MACTKGKGCVQSRVRPLARLSMCITRRARRRAASDGLSHNAVQKPMVACTSAHASPSSSLSSHDDQFPLSSAAGTPSAPADSASWLPHRD